MTWSHPPEALLAALASGDVQRLDDQELIRAALHVDACPACGTRAAALDPMAHVFASADEVVVPSELAAGIVAFASEPALDRPRRQRPVVLATGLLGAALALMFAAGAPGELLLGVLSTSGALLAAAGSLGASLGSPTATATFVAGVGLAASVVTVRQGRRGRSAA